MIKKRESFKILQKNLNQVNEYYKNAFKALIVNNADYKENDQETENKMDEFSNNCDTTFKLNKDKDFQCLYNIFLTIAEKAPKMNEEDKQEIEDGKGCCPCSCLII